MISVIFAKMDLTISPLFIPFKRILPGKMLLMENSVYSKVRLVLKDRLIYNCWNRYVWSRSHRATTNKLARFTSKHYVPSSVPSAQVIQLRLQKDAILIWRTSRIATLPLAFHPLPSTIRHPSSAIRHAPSAVQHLLYPPNE